MIEDMREEEREREIESRELRAESGEGAKDVISRCYGNVRFM